MPATSSNGYQSEQLRAKRVTSIERMRPTSPRVTRGHKLLETAAVVARRAACAEIAVDHLNVSLMPAERAGAAVQRVLQTKALLVGQHLMRGRLTNIDHRPPLQMMRLYEF